MNHEGTTCPCLTQLGANLAPVLQPLYDDFESIGGVVL